MFSDYIEEVTAVGSKSNLWWLILGLSGVLGTILRAIIYFLSSENLVISSYYTTALVNISGSFLLSFLTSLSISQSSNFMLYRDPMLIGFTGSFTTFSSMTYDIQSLLIGSAYLYAMIFLVSQLLLGILSIRIGKRLSISFRTTDLLTIDASLQETL